MHAVVTGAAGRIGASLCEALAASAMMPVLAVDRRTPDAPRAGLTGVRWVEADLRTADLRALFRQAAVVYHLAGEASPRATLEALADSTALGVRVVAAARDVGVPTVVLASSIRVYDMEAGQQRSDTATGESSPRQVEAYAFGKSVVEHFAKQAASPRTRVVAVRLGGVRASRLDYGGAPAPPAHHEVLLTPVLDALVRLPERELEDFSCLTLVGPTGAARYGTDLPDLPSPDRTKSPGRTNH